MSVFGWFAIYGRRKQHKEIKKEKESEIVLGSSCDCDVGENVEPFTLLVEHGRVHNRDKLGRIFLRRVDKTVPSQPTMLGVSVSVCVVIIAVVAVSNML